MILLDLIMPMADLDGVALLSKLVASPPSGIPVIVLSGFGEAVAQQLSPAVAAAALPIAAILPKPVSVDVLTCEIDRLGARIDFGVVYCGRRPSVLPWHHAEACSAAGRKRKPRPIFVLG